MRAMLGRTVWGGSAPRRVVASVLRGYRTSAPCSGAQNWSRQSAPRSRAEFDSTWGAEARLSPKQLSEVDYFRACAARNRSRRARRREGHRQQMSDSDIHRYTKLLYGSSEEAGVNFAKYGDVPVELKGAPNGIEPLATFEDIDALPPYLALNMERCKYANPTPVQKHAVPLGLAGNDVMCCSQTGSGKTAAFLLPAVSKLSTCPAVDCFDEDAGMAAPRVVVLAPTRELAIQTQLEVQKLCFQGPLRSVELCTLSLSLCLSVSLSLSLSLPLCPSVRPSVRPSVSLSLSLSLCSDAPMAPLPAVFSRAPN